MTSNRSWMEHRFDANNNISDEYKEGVRNFIDFALKTKYSHGNIRCPCNDIGNLYFHQSSTVNHHLYRYGIMESYTIWDLHGDVEKPRCQVGTSSSNIGYRGDDMFDAHEIVRDFGEAHGNFEDMGEEPNATSRKFMRCLIMLLNPYIRIIPTLQHYLS